MTKFTNLRIPCERKQWTEVCELLNRLGYRPLNSEFEPRCVSVMTTTTGVFYSSLVFVTREPFIEISIHQLREMALNLDHAEATMEHLWLNLIEAVAEMREAQKYYNQSSIGRSAEKVQIMTELEKQVDEMIQDVTRKPDAKRHEIPNP